MKVLYVIGLPGCGKTTMVETALEITCMAPTPVLDGPVPHVRYDDWLWVIGKPRDDFGGTDTLSMGIQPKAIEWIANLPLNIDYAEPVTGYAPTAVPDVLLGEGDRLANRGFFATCPNLTIIYLDTPIWLARQRMADRAEALGRKPQNESWWKGRVTKVDNLIGGLPHLRFDGRLPPYALGADLADLIVMAKSPATRKPFR
ncbi:MAG TPA: P-loop-containing protein [Nocardioidaceae bacterium]|nr:P-loop-containing protein [Nocardioidaceae bacterium]